MQAITWINFVRTYHYNSDNSSKLPMIWNTFRNKQIKMIQRSFTGVRFIQYRAATYWPLLFFLFSPRRSQFPLVVGSLQRSSIWLTAFIWAIFFSPHSAPWRKCSPGRWHDRWNHLKMDTDVASTAIPRDFCFCFSQSRMTIVHARKSEFPVAPSVRQTLFCNIDLLAKMLRENKASESYYRIEFQLFEYLTGWRHVSIYIWSVRLICLLGTIPKTCGLV